MLDLKDKTLFRTQCYVNGKWIDAISKDTISVDNPALGTELATVPNFMNVDAAKVIDAAWDSWKEWKEMVPQQRAKILHAWYNEIENNLDDLAKILSYEQGKPFAESKGEIALGASYIPWFAEECRRVYGDVIPSPRNNVRPITHHQPVGPVVAITPWNFPSSMITRKAAPALAAGCPIIIKPASVTPYSALALAELAHRAGFPAGVFNVITGNASSIMEEVSNNKKIRKVSFTGSTGIGKILMADCSKTMKKVSLELGGNAPFIVFDDANLDIAVNCFMAAKFRNAGQACIAANRVFVHKNVYDDFLARILERVKALKVGPCTDLSSEIGPIISVKAMQGIDAMVQDAASKGAKIELGGKAHELGLSYYEPTIVTGVKKGMRLFDEEVFGPVAPIIAFDTEEEVIELANDTEYGLAAYVFTQDLGRSWRLPEALEYGLVGVNDVALAMSEAPFGGVKESGTGREGGHEGLHDFFETRYVLIGGLQK